MYLPILVYFSYIFTGGCMGTGHFFRKKKKTKNKEVMATI